MKPGAIHVRESLKAQRRMEVVTVLTLIVAMFSLWVALGAEWNLVVSDVMNIDILSVP
jgi:hypothetical protein